ncbi:MAG: site-specific DNA-methyltransferase [Syntrophales bacterium]|nr:site-specific DNA-methyltransferase [Syntrophales bacterium]
MLNTIICGDALEVMRGMPENSVDMVFTDPPYGHNNNNGDLISRWEAALGVGEYMEEMNRPINNDGPEANELFRAVLPEIRRILKPGSCCCCCCGGGGGPDPQFARWALWMDEVLEFKQMVVWDKGPMGMGWHYRRSYEIVLVAMKPGAACAWYDTTKKIENIIRPGYLGIRKIIPTKDDHPTPKPIELAAHFILLHSKPGDIVLDCFAGSGRTLVAAEKLGRNWIGIDNDPQWQTMAQDRIYRECQQVTIAQAIARAKEHP